MTDFQPIQFSRVVEGTIPDPENVSELEILDWALCCSMPGVRVSLPPAVYVRVRAKIKELYGGIPSQGAGVLDGAT